MNFSKILESGDFNYWFRQRDKSGVDWLILIKFEPYREARARIRRIPGDPAKYELIEDPEVEW